MVDSWLETSLHPVHDLVLLPGVCRCSTYEYQRATNARNIAKVACAVGLQRIVKYTSIQSIWGVAVTLSHVLLRDRLMCNSLYRAPMPLNDYFLPRLMPFYKKEKKRNTVIS